MPASTSSRRWPTCSASPAATRNVLEIFHRCLAMGFEGRYRVSRDRSGDVDGVRKSVARTLAELAGPAEPTLSPHWAGVAVAARSPGTIVPPWVVWTAAAALLLALYTGFRYRVAGYSEQLAPLVAGLPPVPAVGSPADGPPASARPAGDSQPSSIPASWPRSSARAWSRCRRARSAC